MAEIRPWAFWRRVQYGTAYFMFVFVSGTIMYLMSSFTIPTCYDGILNADETGIDCGGSCTRICTVDVIPPKIVWAESFKITDGQYNALAYIENQNQIAGTPNFSYTFRLYDEQDNLITERSGFSTLPPNSTYPMFEGKINTGLAKPARTEIDFDMPDLWLPAEIGRDQFRALDIELIGADERPRLNVEMENTELSEAEDVEVVATIFDRSGKPLTASQTFIELFEPRSQKDLVFTWPLPISRTLRSCEIPTDIVVAIDLSGSMNNDQANPPEPITSVLAAAGDFVDNLHGNDQAALVTFATAAVLRQPLTDNITTVQNRIAGLTIDPQEEQGSTNIGEAFYAAQQELNTIRHNTDARNVVVLLTDGLATAPDEEPEAYALEAANTLKNDNVIIYTIGLGSAVNMDFLKSAASIEENAYYAASAADLNDIYTAITSAICEDGAARIDIIPKTGANFEPL